MWKNKDDVISSVDVRSGDTLIIEEDKNAPRPTLDGYKKSLSSEKKKKMSRK